jgi:hypothetical protein
LELLHPWFECSHPPTREEQARRGRKVCAKSSDGYLLGAARQAGSVYDSRYAESYGRKGGVLVNIQKEDDYSFSPSSRLVE